MKNFTRVVAQIRRLAGTRGMGVKTPQSHRRWAGPLTGIRNGVLRVHREGEDAGKWAPMATSARALRLTQCAQFIRKFNGHSPEARFGRMQLIVPPDFVGVVR